MKKTISLIIAVIMAFGVFSVSASAQQQIPKRSELYSIKPSEFNSAATEPAEDTELTEEDYAEIRALYNDIHTALKNRETILDISKYAIPPDNDGRLALQTVLQAVLDNTYDLLLGKTLKYSYSSNETIIELSFEYPDSKELYKKHYNEAMQAIENIIADMPSGFTDLEKVLYVYNYLALNFEYDFDLYDKDKADNVVRDIYRFFNEKKGVCQAYTKAFSAIMDRLGIECYEVIDNAANHTWNVVGLNGKYYNIDTTWADPVTVTADDKYYDMTGNVSYDWFLLSDETITQSADSSSNGGHTENAFIYDNILLGKKIECTDKTYENGYAWSNTETPLTYCEGNWYYICDYAYEDRCANLNYTDSSFKNITNEMVFELSNWGFDNNSELIFDSCFTSLFAYGNYLCFNSNNQILYYDVKEQIYNILLTTFDGNNLFGCSYDGHGNITAELRNYSVIGNSIVLNSVERSAEKIYLADYCENNERAENLVKLKKYLVTGEMDGNWGYYDVSGNIGLDIRDLIKLKKVYAQ